MVELTWRIVRMVELTWRSVRMVEPTWRRQETYEEPKHDGVLSSILRAAKAHIHDSRFSGGWFLSQN